MSSLTEHSSKNTAHSVGPQTVGKGAVGWVAGAEAMTAILDALLPGERFLVCHQSRPDGDGVDSMPVMGFLREIGKQAAESPAAGVDGLAAVSP